MIPISDQQQEFFNEKQNTLEQTTSQLNAAAANLLSNTADSYNTNKRQIRNGHRHTTDLEYDDDDDDDEEDDVNDIENEIGDDENDDDDDSLSEGLNDSFGNNENSSSRRLKQQNGGFKTTTSNSNSSKQQILNGHKTKANGTNGTTKLNGTNSENTADSSMDNLDDYENTASNEHASGKLLKYLFSSY